MQVNNNMSAQNFGMALKIKPEAMPALKNASIEIVNKYSKNYPITIVPMAGGIRKQIMVGPLSVDEYAVVLERFRSYGYKDAFLRKIK